jgi:acetyltransferase-like isoleucine patch superfamily enzyme
MNIGSYTYGSQNIKIYQWGENKKLYIGKFCSLADNIKIYLGGNHRVDWITTYPFGLINEKIFNTYNVKHNGHPKSNGDVVIGNDVWIGNDVTIMSGINISDGAVIAANSHVVKNIEPYSIVGGNPARLIKKRFSEDQIQKLQEIKWWDWENDKINKNLSLICSDNIQIFIDKFS